MKKILILFIFIILLNNIFSQTFYPTTINELDATIKLFGFGKISGLEKGQEVTFQTITFPQTEYQKTRVISEALYINDKTIYPEYIFDEFDNKYVKFRIPENGDFTFEIIAQIKTQAIIYEINDVNIGNYPKQIKKFVESSPLIESNSLEIQSIVKNKLKENSFLNTLNDVIFKVNDYVDYAQGDEFQKYYLLQKSATDTLLSKKGVCDEFTNLAAAFLRAKNIPTRIIIGPTFDGKEWGNHAWLEVYHEEIGWIPSDPTFREPGFVDGTHIKMGSFTDITLSQAKAIFPKNVEISFQTQTIPEVTINSKKYFSHVELTWNPKKLKANQWNDLEILVKNNTNGQLTIPIKILETYSDIYFYDKTKSITLKGNESEKIIFKIYPKINLEDNELAKGKLTFNSLREPYEIEFEITPAIELNNGEVIINRIMPITTATNIRFEINVSNNTPNPKEISIKINDTNYFETLQAFQNIWIRKEATIDTNQYLIEIITPTQTYTQTLTAIEQKIIIEQKPTETIIIQQIKTKDPDKPLFGTLELTVFALLPIISILLLILFAVKKKYV
ncbi:MAG: transglutaminase-like domain-containing protein [Candidatus ainarchaeum sp.]|nr:transglutaminase-like domain-containing protein [Candidatus ainarchaeum sp.]